VLVTPDGFSTKNFRDRRSCAAAGPRPLGAPASRGPPARRPAQRRPPAPLEGCERQHGAPPHRRLVGTTSQHRRQPARVADGAERCHGGLPHKHLVALGERGGISSCELVVGSLSSCSPAAQAAASTTAACGSRSNGQRDVGAARCQQGGAMTHGGVVVGETCLEVVIGEPAHSIQCAECQLPGHRVGGGKTGSGDRFVALVAGDHQVAPLLVLGAHCFSMIGEGDHQPRNAEPDDGGDHGAHPHRERAAGGDGPQPPPPARDRFAASVP
jgi:hypothetical protein